MASMTMFFLLMCAPALSFAHNPHNIRAPSPLWRRASSRNIPPAGYYNPLTNGGDVLTIAPGTGGLGEPLNVIISGASDETVLVDQETDGGLRNYFFSFGFGSECLGQHSGDAQTANLGDGNGYVNETAEIRWDYGDPQLGTCTETIEGGDHFRYWVQDGKDADSGAIFMASSYELPIQEGHDIIFDGYNLGRDWLVGNATAQSSLIPTPNVTNTSMYSGQTSFGGYTYQTDAAYVSGILSNTSTGVNHYLTVGGNGINAIDGLVAVLTVKVVSRPAATSDAQITLSTPPWHLSVLLVLATFAISLCA